jgi:OmcA/MtrC family decaheme c-type cytochrome
MIHGMHASATIETPFDVCGFGNSVHSYDFVYPGKLNNCEGCHLADTYYPVEPGQMLGTTFDVNDPATPTDDRVVSPNASVCSACHIEPADTTHMLANGADFNATKAADSTLVSSEVESCVICHGPGRVKDVKAVHDVEAFEFN